MRRKKPVHCLGMRMSTVQYLRGLIVDTANAVRKISDKAVSADSDDVEFVYPPHRFCEVRRCDV